jgi:IclR family pca regulon transcriptional regulator
MARRQATRIKELPEAPAISGSEVTAMRQVAAPSFTDPNVLASEAIERHADDPDFVTALARGLAVLLALSDKRRHMSIAQVAHRTGIPRAAARRSLHTLSKLGFAASDEARRFYLRPRVLSFSHAYLSASPLTTLAQPILDRLGDSTHEACSLAMLDGDEIVYLARSTSSRIMSPALNVGRRQPAYCTSVGQLMLAHLPPEELAGYLTRVRLHPFTEHTISTAARLKAALEFARDMDYTYCAQQTELRLCSMAVPVRDTAGTYVAGINLILQGRLLDRDEMAARFLRPLQDAARELGALLIP